MQKETIIVIDKIRKKVESIRPKILETDRRIPLYTKMLMNVLKIVIRMFEIFKYDQKDI